MFSRSQLIFFVNFRSVWRVRSPSTSYTEAPIRFSPLPLGNVVDFHSPNERASIEIPLPLHAQIVLLQYGDNSVLHELHGERLVKGADFFLLRFIQRFPFILVLGIGKKGAKANVGPAALCEAFGVLLMEVNVSLSTHGCHQSHPKSLRRRKYRSK